MSSEFGNKLKKIREINGISQVEIANMLNVHKATVSKWEKGKTEPDLITLKTIAKILEVSIDELLDEQPYDYNFEYHHKNTTLIHKEKNFKE